VRITYFTDTEEVGGAERYLADLAAGAIEAEHDVTVLAPQPDVLDFIHETAPAAQLGLAGTRVQHKKTTTPGRAGVLAKALPRLAGSFHRARPDIVHVNNGGYPGSDLCRMAPLAARIAGVRPSVMTINSMPWERSRDSTPQVQIAADTLLWRTVDAVICPAMIVGKALIENRSMPPELLRHIRYGAREPGGQGEPAAELRRRLAPDGELLVGMVSARAIPEKGFDVFVDALARTGKATRGVLVGHHPGAPLQRLIEQRGLNERLKVEGPVPAVNAYYHAIDVLVVPSTAEECMPFVILEAMAAGKAVFASRLSGAPEAVVDGDTGRLFTPGSVDELAALLADIPAEGDRTRLSEMGARGRARWKSLFSPPAVMSATLSFYEEIGGGSGEYPAAAVRRKLVRR
jgi:glycosyltransferase involved in cell wall biosynthesis